MKPLPAAVTAATQRPHAKPIYLGVLEFTAPSAKTLRFSDALRVVAGQEYPALVASWGTLEATLNALDVDGRPGTTEISFFNTRPVEGRARLSDLILTPQNTGEAYQWAFAKLTISLVLADVDMAPVPLEVFYLEDPTELGDEQLTVRMTDRALVLENAMLRTRCDVATFPYVSSAILDRTVNRLAGVLTNVEALPVVAGAVTALVGDLTAVATTVPIADGSRLDGAGTVMLDTEHIAYAGNTGSSLTGCTRGANGTTAAAHSDQAKVYDVRSEYIFAAGEHDASFKTKQITNIRVDGRPARTAPAVEIDKTNLVTGKRFACIKFTPASVKEFHIVPFGPFPITVAQISASVPNGGDANATRTVALPACERLGGPHERAVAFTVTVGGASPAAVSWSVSRKVNGAFVEIARGLGVSSAGSDSRQFTTQADDELRLDVSLPASTAGNATVVFNSYTVSVSPGDTSSTAAAAIGKVTCDVQGIQDDGAGSISGTPNQLLENPADITKFWLTRLFPGVTAADLGATFPVTRASLAAAAYKWAAVLEPMRFSELRKKLGEQAQSVLYIQGGRFEYKFLAAAPTSQKTLDFPREVSKAVPARITRTARTDIRTSLTVSSQYDWSAGTYRRVKSFTDLTQPGLPDPIDDTLELDLVQDPATADALGAYWLNWRKRQHFACDLVAWWNLLATEKVDYLSIDNHPTLAAHGGAAVVFRLVGQSYLAGDENPGRIRLTGVEV